MAFKRALWHSGLTYQQTCYHCRAVVRYTDYQLDFRPWYPDGFVYCPRCKGPLRHNELRYTVDNSDESLGKKIRGATKMKIPCILIVGPKDVESEEVSVRLRDSETKVKLADLKEYLLGL